MKIEDPLPNNSLKNIIGIFAKTFSACVPALSVYKLLDICGIGSNGCVFTVRNQEDNQIYALKIINLSYYLINGFSLDPVLSHETAYVRFKEISEDILSSTYSAECYRQKKLTNFSSDAEKNSFLREFNALKCLPANKNTVYLEDYGYIAVKSNGKNKYNYYVPYIVMPLLEGDALTSKIEQEMKPSERLIQTFSWIEKIIPIISFIHANGVIHRDLYSNNFLVNNTNSEIMLVDFGSSIAKRNFHIDTPGERRGARRFMSPEQFKNPSSVDFRSDYFFIGSLIFYCLSLETPFNRSRDEKTLPKQFYTVYPKPACISQATYRAICDYVEKLIEFYPTNRFQTLKDIQNAFNAIKNELQKDLCND